MPVDLQMLMSRYCGGDRDAFSTLYEHVSPKLLRYLLRLSGDRATAEDLLQASFLKVHRARASYVEGANPLPWIYAIAYRTFLDETRRKKRSKLVDTGGDVPEQQASLDGQPNDARRSEIDPATLEQVMTALQTLSPSQRQAVILTKLEGKSMSEAAEIAGTSVGAMKVRAHRGYERLRKELGDGVP